MLMSVDLLERIVGNLLHLRTCRAPRIFIGSLVDKDQVEDAFNDYSTNLKKFPSETEELESQHAYYYEDYGTMSELLSGISNLTKQISNNIPYQIKKLGESVHTMVMNYTEAENLVYEATNEDPWGPTGPQMKEIANYTFQYEGFHQVMNLLWKRMLEDNKTAWRRVYKSLTLLNHLLFHGSERVIGNARDHTFQMRVLEHYKYVDDRGRDQGLNVRSIIGVEVGSLVAVLMSREI
ncbi:ENTH domain protein [Ancylostoma ceylanicum]|uniref:ENTH domain protein n=1 Tax=Ancylostoma ceylanicum TaxID=53326 RepID=A0A0D6LAW9_9BILA|nr:ENTH domain protein [Ancylostoma ceylanicum]